MDHCDDVLRSAPPPGRGALDGASDHGTDGLTEGRAARGAGADPGADPEPRPQAAAGEMWCLAELHAVYLAGMEDVLALYERPYHRREPVVCLDEKPVSLHADARAPCTARPRHVATRHTDYRRCGTANIFAVVEPKLTAVSLVLLRIARRRRLPRWSLPSCAHIRGSALSISCSTISAGIEGKRSRCTTCRCKGVGSTKARSNGASSRAGVWRSASTASQISGGTRGSGRAAPIVGAPRSCERSHEHTRAMCALIKSQWKSDRRSTLHN